MYNNNPLRIILVMSLLIILVVSVTSASPISKTNKDNNFNQTIVLGDTIYVDDDFNESTVGWGDYRFDNIIFRKIGLN